MVCALDSRRSSVFLRKSSFAWWVGTELAGSVRHLDWIIDRLYPDSTCNCWRSRNRERRRLEDCLLEVGGNQRILGRFSSKSHPQPTSCWLYLAGFHNVQQYPLDSLFLQESWLRVYFSLDRYGLRHHAGTKFVWDGIPHRPSLYQS